MVITILKKQIKTLWELTLLKNLDIWGAFIGKNQNTKKVTFSRDYWGTKKTWGYAIDRIYTEETVYFKLKFRHKKKNYASKLVIWYTKSRTWGVTKGKISER